MSINAHKEGPPRLVIGLRTRAIQISPRRRVAGRLRIPCPVVADIKQVIYPAGEAQIFVHIPGRTEADNAVWADFV